MDIDLVAVSQAITVRVDVERIRAVQGQLIAVTYTIVVGILVVRPGPRIEFLLVGQAVTVIIGVGVRNTVRGFENIRQAVCVPVQIDSYNLDRRPARNDVLNRGRTRADFRFASDFCVIDQYTGSM